MANHPPGSAVVQLVCMPGADASGCLAALAQIGGGEL